MSDMNLIHGRSICAMVNDNTSVKEMLQMMGVDPTAEMVSEAINHFALNGGNVTMETLYDFLKEKNILTDNQKVASVADAR
jgi:Ca2+-binding EF-hand superfamily protein